MSNIIPLDGYILAKKTSELQSIETEMSEIKGMKFLVVDEKAKRNECNGNKTRIRLFNIVRVSDDASEKIKSYVGKNMYCICLENEDANNVIIDGKSGDKLFVLPVGDVLAELRD